MALLNLSDLFDTEGRQAGHANIRRCPGDRSTEKVLTKSSVVSESLRNPTRLNSRRPKRLISSRVIVRVVFGLQVKATGVDVATQNVRQGLT